jgi:hypothetical protein
VNTTDRTGTSLPAFVSAHAPMPPLRAGLFAAELAEQLAVRHADGAVQGGLAETVRVCEVDGRYRPVLGRPSGRDGAPESDVRELGAVLARLLGVRPPLADRPTPPVGLPDPLWTVVVDTQHTDRARRPPAAVVARRLRDAARDLLLAEAPWPSAVAPPAYVPGADEQDPEDPPPPTRRSRRTLVIVGATVVVLVAAVALALTMGGGSNGGAAGGNRPPPSTSGQSPLPPVQVCLNPNCVVQVTFRPDGDQFSVCDKAKDGHSALAVYSRADQPGEKSIWASKGDGTCVNQRVEMPARTRVTVKACTGERAQNRIVACSDPVTAMA